MPLDLMVVHYNSVALFAAWFLVMYAIYLQALVVRRVRASEGDLRLGWWIGGALAVGTGIWAQSFVGLLSMQLPTTTGYLPAVVLSAWLPAVVVSGASIWLAGKVQASLTVRIVEASFAALALSFITYLHVSSMVLSTGVTWNVWLAALALMVTVIGCSVGSVMLRRELLTQAHLGRQLLVGIVLGSFLRLGQMIMLAAAGVPGSAVSLTAGQLTGDYLEWIVTGTVLVLFVLVQLGTMLDTRLRGQHVHLVSSLQRVQNQLHTAAQRDTLTGLLNRQGFEDHLSAVLQSADESGGKLAVIRINLDGFRELVNTYGHALGDTLLRQVANRLLVLVRSTDAPARADGEEFLLLLRSMPDQLTVAQLAQRIGLAISQPSVIHGEDVTVTCSIGVAMYPESATLEHLINHANEAMLTASKAGGGVHCFYDPGMVHTGADQVEMQRDLRYAIARGELALNYQPKLDAKSGNLIGVEALLRWRHPVRGFVSPADFIPVAERFGLIGELGFWVLNEACRQMRVWLEAGLVLPVAINMSAHQLREHDLSAQVSDTLAKHQVPATMLIMEITESVAMDDIEASLRVFDVLSRLGVKLSIDDFGTGYSSLSYLRRLSAQQLKIDRSFVNDLDHSHDARAIVEAVVRLSHALGLRVVAEGVETEAQRKVLVDLGCDELQGYLLGRPMTAAALQDWMDTQLAQRALAKTELEAALIHDAGLGSDTVLILPGDAVAKVLHVDV